MKKRLPLFVSGSFLVPSIAFAAPSTIKDLSQLFISILNLGSLMLIASSVAVYLGVALFQIWDVSRGKTKKGEATTRLLWGIVIIFFMVSIWGIMQMLEYTFFGGPSPQGNNGVVNF